jgi:hypothetical protein
MVAKNKPNTLHSIEKDSYSFRNNQLTSNVHNNKPNLENIGVTERNQELSKNKLLQSTLNIDSVTEGIKNNILAQNVIKNIDLEKQSEQYRNNNLAVNSNKNTDLEKGSSQFRDNNLSLNPEKNSDLEKGSTQFRNNNISLNSDKTTNLEKNSNSFRDNNLSLNSDKTTDLEKGSTQFRDNNISLNSDKTTDLERNSNSFRDNNLSLNSDKTSDLEKGSAQFRDNNLSLNSDKTTDLEKGSTQFRDNNISLNSDKTTNLEKGSTQFRDNNTSLNSDKTTDLEKGSTTFRDNNLSLNSDKTTDLEKGSTQYRDNNLSVNAPKNTDLEKLSSGQRQDDLSKNVPIKTNIDSSANSKRNKELASNVPLNLSIDNTADAERNKELASNVTSNLNIDSTSDSERNKELASNVASNLNIDSSATSERDKELASNVVSNLNIDSTSNTERNKELASNVASNLSIDSTSKEERDKELTHNVLSKNSIYKFITPDGFPSTSSNERKKELSSNYSKHESVQNFTNQDGSKGTAGGERKKELSHNTASKITLDNFISQDGSKSTASVFRHNMLAKNGNNVLGVNLMALGTSQFIGVSNLWVSGVAIRAITAVKDKAMSWLFKNDLQEKYGTNISNDGVSPTATITNSIQLHNISQNAFAWVNYGQNTDSVIVYNNNEGFQDLLSKELEKGFGNSAQVGKQSETNATPLGIIEENGGRYLNSEPEDSLRTGGLKATGVDSMMVQTVPSDVINLDDQFYSRRRGVAYIIDQIKGSRNLRPTTISKNYEVQGENGVSKNDFVIGLVPGTKIPKIASSRYSIKNPYAPKGAGTLTLKFKNYANGQTLSFPPYVQSFSHSDTASWLGEVFLGRPEPVYTYGSGSRGGTISFFVLTDFCESVDIGYQDYPRNLSTYTEGFYGYNFASQINDFETYKKEIEAQIEEKIKETIALINKKYECSTLQDSNTIDNRINDIGKEVTSLNDLIRMAKVDSERVYSESDSFSINRYRDIMQGKSDDTPSKYKESYPADTITILDNMKQGLLFQPAFFSGSKTDFVTRMEFISKMTKPSRKRSEKDKPDTGFSFLNPPVCHMWLGDWINNDIVVNSINYDYTDSPWTFDNDSKRKVQPMWVIVTLDFNIVGQWSNSGGGNVPLADDSGGFYDEKR